MKKIYIGMAALAAVTLVSCVQEKSFDEKPLGKDELRLSLQGSTSTRSRELMDPQTFSYFAGEDKEKGLSFIMEEVVEDLNYASPATKGTPAYTENVGKLYHNLNVVAKGGDSDIVTNFWAMDDAQQEGAGWRYQGNFNWEQDSYDFYMSMPEDMTSKGVSNLKYANKTITFDYSATDGTTATALQDLIFSAQTITKSQAETNRVNGVPVLFHHALTGVKFRIANNDELDLDEDGKPKGKENRTQTYITKVTITGLKNSGSCTITPRAETNGYVDDPTGDYSSGDGTFTSGVVAWTYETGTGSYSQSYTEAQNLTAYSGSTTTGEGDAAVTTSGSFQSNGNYPDTFSAAGNTYNLNDADASMTFWFIPQALTEDVEITVEFHVWDGEENVYAGPKTPKEQAKETPQTLTLKLGKEVLKKTGDALTLTRDWKAGQLRTFSLKPQHVDVEIRDKMEKWVKSNVMIKNTGNVAEYVRVYIIGNWVGYRQIDEDEDGNPIYNDYETVLMGYKSNEKDEFGQYVSNEEVERWNDKDFRWNGDTKVYPDWETPNGTYHYTPYGVFDGLPEMGTSSGPGAENNRWIRHDKFYYYMDPIGPGMQVPDSKPLFKSYEVGKSPDFYIADNWGERRLAKDVHLVIDIAVQAIQAPIDEETGQPLKTYLQAWTDALNPTGSTSWNINDL